MVITNNEISITFTPADPSKTFRLAKSTDLKTWTTLPDPPTVVGATLVFKAPVGTDPSTFYQVVQL